MTIEATENRTTRMALWGALVAAVLSLACVLTPAAFYAYHWFTTGGQTGDAGHPPLTVYVFVACLYFVPALSLLGLALGLAARREMARRRSALLAAFGLHTLALLAAAGGWIWMFMSSG